MKIIGAAPREGIKPSPTSVSVLNANIFRRGGVYPLPNQNPIFYVHGGACDGASLDPQEII